MDDWLRLPPKKSNDSFDILKEIERMKAEQEGYMQRIEELKTRSIKYRVDKDNENYLLRQEVKELKDIIQTYQKTVEAFKYIKRI
jgi:hypothetical protein